jgi:hypothetical protein
MHCQHGQVDVNGRYVLATNLTCKYRTQLTINTGAIHIIASITIGKSFIKLASVVHDGSLDRAQLAHIHRWNVCFDEDLPVEISGTSVIKLLWP